MYQLFEELYDVTAIVTQQEDLRVLYVWQGLKNTPTYIPFSFSGWKVKLKTIKTIIV